jgi:hypothetical protein
MVRLPEADSRMLLNELVQRIDNRSVVTLTTFVAVRAVGNTCRPAALTDAHAMLFSHVRNQPPSLVRA